MPTADVRPLTAVTNEVVHTSTEVASRLRYSDEHIRRLCEDGRFPDAYRTGVGAHWRIPESAVQAFFQETRPKRRRALL
jgi:excisionase family DNA binding protein